MQQGQSYPHAFVKEKSDVALSSMLAAVFLTGFKAIVGFTTGSLGILAEALHSALDLAAAVMTFVAVRISDRPPDDVHPYGHGKIESVSAFLETLLLVATCVWIIHEGVVRLLYKTVEIQANIWAFLVIITSIVVDISRSRALSRAAERHHSQALKADALHFSTDIWSSAVVLLGLILVKVGEWTGHASVLVRADAVAALGVAAIVLWISFNMGKETMQVLLDTAPEGLAERIVQRAREVLGVVDCRNIRVRQVGPRVFVDMVIDVSRTIPLEQAHWVASQVESRIHELRPGADVLIHYEPVATAGEDWAKRIQSIADREGLQIHEVLVHERRNARKVSLHLEVDQRLSLAEAHAVADRLEQEIRAQMKEVDEVQTHIEPRMIKPLSGRDAPERLPEVLEALKKIARHTPTLRGHHDVQIWKSERRLYVSMHCVCDADIPIRDIHQLSSHVEGQLKEAIPEIENVHIHAEPPGA